MYAKKQPKKNELNDPKIGAAKSKATALHLVDNKNISEMATVKDPADIGGKLPECPRNEPAVVKKHYEFIRQNWWWCRQGDFPLVLDLCRIWHQRDQLNRQLNGAFELDNLDAVEVLVRSLEKTSAQWLRLLDRLGGSPGARSTRAFAETYEHAVTKDPRDKVLGNIID